VKEQNKILRILNIRREESWLVSQLFFLQFFQGVGVALFFAVAYALFLEKKEAHELTWVYLIAAGLLWIAGYIYSRLEHLLSVRNLIGTVIAIMAISVGLFRIGISMSLTGWFLYLMVAWYYILYLLINLSFWGLSSLLFDIRQSKRLFGIISAGDIPARLIGYFSVYIIVPYIGSADMLYIAMGSIGLSFVFWYNLARAGSLDLHVDHHEHHQHEGHLDGSIVKMVKSFFGSKLILSVAILSFTVVAATTIIRFTFYVEVKERIHDNEHLATFIGLFFALGSLVAIFLKLMITGKLADSLGIRGSLLITPAVLMMAIFAVTLSPTLSDGSSSILYVFGVMAILSETLKAAIQDPVFIAVMQPLKKSLRLRGHTIVKGVMDPFALAFGSAVLFAVMYFAGGVEIHTLCYILLIMILAWIAFIFIVDRNYLSSLVDGLNNRYVSGREIDLTNETTLDLMTRKIPTAKAGEAIYLMELAAKLPDARKDELIKTGLHNADEDVRIEAIKLIEAKKIHSALPQLQEIIAANPSKRMLAQAIQAVCIIQHEEDVEDFSYYLDSQDYAVVKAAVIGLLRNGSINAVVSAGQKLQQLRDSEDTDERAIAAEVVGELKVKSFYKSLLKLLSDQNDKVVMAAIQASGRLQSEKLVSVFIKYIADKKYERTVLHALYQSGHAALSSLSEMITDLHTGRDIRLKLINTVAKIGGKDAQSILESCLDSFPALRGELYYALHICRYRVGDGDRDLFIARENHEMDFAVNLLAQVSWLGQNKTGSEMERALTLELNQTRDRLLWLFSFIYDEEKIMRARNGFIINKKESRANAQEIIDLIVPKDTASKFNMLFEQATVAERVNMLRQSIKTNPMDFDSIATEILSSKEYQYNSWTKAVAIYAMDQASLEKHKEQITANINTNEPLLNETSISALAKLKATT